MCFFGSDLVNKIPQILRAKHNQTHVEPCFLLQIFEPPSSSRARNKSKQSQFPNLCLLKVCLKGVAENFQTLEDFNPWLSTWACKPPSQLLVLVLAAQITVFFSAILSRCCATKPKSTISLGLKPSKKPVHHLVGWLRISVPSLSDASSPQGQRRFDKKMGFNPFKEGFTGDLVGYVRYVL